MFSLSNITKRINQTLVQEVPLTLIKPCKHQSRQQVTKQGIDSLTASILENGILQPLTATLNDEGGFTLIAGHRRLLAAKRAGLLTVPIIVLEKDEKEAAILNIVENIQREDLNFFEQARAIKTLIDELNLTQKEVAVKLSLSQPSVANKLKLLSFTKEIQDIITQNKLTERHARAVVRINTSKQKKALEYIINNSLNVKQTDEYINKLLFPKTIKKQKVIVNIKDIRLFSNTITKAVNILKKAGVDTHLEQNEDETCFFYTIKVPKKERQEVK